MKKSQIPQKTEIFLAWTPAFHWVYPWWGALPLFITVYIPFFYGAFLCYDWKPKTQKIFIGTLFFIDALMIVVFAGILGWIQPNAADVDLSFPRPPSRKGR